MRHRVFSTVSGSPLLFWIFRMSVERRRREDTVVRKRVSECRFLRERERRARRSPSLCFWRCFRLSHFFKNRTTRRLFRSPHAMRARERERETTRRRRRRPHRRRLLRWSRASSKLSETQGRQKDRNALLEKEKGKIPHERERERERMNE